MLQPSDHDAREPSVAPSGRRQEDHVTADQAAVSLPGHRAWRRPSPFSAGQSAYEDEWVSKIRTSRIPRAGIGLHEGGDPKARLLGGRTRGEFITEQEFLRRAEGEPAGST